MTDDVRNVSDALDLLSEQWQPHRLVSVNDYDVKVVKLQGEFVWQMRDRDVQLGPDDVFVVPAGVEHCPRADSEVSALLFEPKGTVNTGDVGGDRTSPLREF